MTEDQQPTPWTPPGDTPPWQPGAVIASAGIHSEQSSRKTAAIAAVAVAALAVGGGAFYLQRDSGPKSPPAQPTTSSKAPTAAVAPPSTAKVSATGWDDRSVHPVTAPVLVAGRIVVYTADNGTLSLRAVDPKSGSTLWVRPASVAGNTRGQPFDVAALGRDVFYLSPAGDPKDEAARVVSIDAVTGKQKWMSRNALQYSQPPDLCSDKLAVCLSAYDGDAAVAIRVDLATGKEIAVTRNGGRLLGSGVVDPGLRDPEYIQHLDDKTGKVVWKQPVNTLVGSPVSSDNGWNWDSYGDVYVGWLGADAPDSEIIRLDGEKTIAVRASDGRRLWVTPGLYGCPVQGLTNRGRAFAVRCVIKGTISEGADGTPKTSGFDVTIQGFDIHTGKTLWSTHVGDVPSAIGLDSRDPVRMNGEVFALTDSKKRTVLINFTTGAVSRPAAGAKGWCMQESYWTLKDLIDDDGKPAEYVTGGLIGPCTPAGARTAPSDGTSTGMGATAGGYFVYSSTDGLHAFKLVKAGS